MEYAGFVQYVMNHPWLVAAAIFAFGITSTFFGGKLFDYVVASLAGIMTFLVSCMFASAFGMFRALEAHSSASAGRVFVALLGFAIAGGLGLIAGYFVKKTSRVAMGVLGGIAGLFVSVLAYSLVFAKFVTQNTWLLKASVLTGVIGGSYLAFKFKQAILVQLTATVGAYMTIRAISMVFGGYINEFEVISLMKEGVFELPNTFYAYLAGFATLVVGGTFFQWHKGYHKHINFDGQEIDEHFIQK